MLCHLPDYYLTLLLTDDTAIPHRPGTVGRAGPRRAHCIFVLRRARQLRGDSSAAIGAAGRSFATSAPKGQIAGRRAPPRQQVPPP